MTLTQPLFPSYELLSLQTNSRVLPESKAVARVIAPLLSALAYIHERRFIHRGENPRLHLTKFLLPAAFEPSKNPLHVPLRFSNRYQAGERISGQGGHYIG